MERQLNIFDVIGYPEEDTKFNPIKEYALRGSGFVNSKKRIRKYFLENHGFINEVNFLKKEYGTGGFGIPGKEPLTLTGGDYNSQGHVLNWIDEEGNLQTLRISYEELVREIHRLIERGYYTGNE